MDDTSRIPTYRGTVRDVKTTYYHPLHKKKKKKAPIQMSPSNPVPPRPNYVAMQAGSSRSVRSMESCDKSQLLFRLLHLRPPPPLYTKRTDL